MRFWSILAATLVLVTNAQAKVPQVVTSIAPVQGLVEDVMRGVGSARGLLQAGISPHDFALRPSQAHAISQSDIVFYVGLDLEPWLEQALRTSGSKRVEVRLGELAGVHRLPARSLQEFVTENPNAPAEGPIDPHVWLDPENAQIWLASIAERLSTLDPEHAQAYQQNARNASAAIERAKFKSAASLMPLRGINLIVTHDSLQYFEHVFGLHVGNSFSSSDGKNAGARSTSKLLSSLGPDACVVEDITHPIGRLAALPKSVVQVEIDPMGYGALESDSFYPALLEDMTASLLACLP